MFFDNSQELLRVAVVGLAGYAGLVVLLRLTGKRTLSKWNAFDLVVTVALGSTFATLLLSKQVSFLQGLVGLALLVCMQFVVTWLSVRSPWIRSVVKAEPVFLFRSGEFLESTLRRERVTNSEVRAAVRQSGLQSMHDVACVVLETDGSVSVIAKSDATDESALLDVK